MTNDRRYDGKVNADGAVWSNSAWHLIEVLEAIGFGPTEDHRAFYANCSCGWSGPTRIKVPLKRGKGGTVTISPKLVATEDGQRHAWGDTF